MDCLSSMNYILGVPKWRHLLSISSVLPCKVYTGGQRVVSIPVDIEPYYTLGRAADQVSIALDHQSCSRVHAAIVHHTDGRIFLIDLQSVRRCCLASFTAAGPPKWQGTGFSGAAFVRVLLAAVLMADYL